LEHPNVEADAKDNNGRTPLSWAAENGLETVVRLLLKRTDVEADSQNEGGRTPFMWAAKNHHWAIDKLLGARNDVERNSKDHQGKLTVHRWMELAAASSDLWECQTTRPKLLTVLRTVNHRLVIDFRNWELEDVLFPGTSYLAV